LVIVSGDQQPGFTGTALASPLVHAVNNFLNVVSLQLDCRDEFAISIGRATGRILRSPRPHQRERRCGSPMSVTLPRTD
jgi:hypothetical protein